MRMVVLINSVVALLLAPVQGINASDIISKIATGEDYGTVINSKVPGGGPMTENVRMIFKDMGYDPLIDFLPWQRAYVETSRGKYIAAFPWTEFPERAKIFQFSKPLLSLSLKAYVLNSFPAAQLDGKSAKGLTTCDLLGSLVLDEIKAQYDFKVILVPKLSQCFEMLANRRIDFLMVNSDLPEKNKGRGYKTIPDEFHLQIKLCLIVSKQQANATMIIDKFNASMLKLQNKGLLKSVRNDPPLLPKPVQ